jgi:poly-gamma-glutamate synthesis protein (capsule biosynthesis protein)
MKRTTKLTLQTMGIMVLMAVAAAGGFFAWQTRSTNEYEFVPAHFAVYTPAPQPAPTPTPEPTPVYVPVYIPEPEPEYEYEPEYTGCPYTVSVTISFAGDTTFGGDRRWRGYHRFMEEWSNSGYNHAHFFKNVADIFYESCLSIVNLEGTLTYLQYPHMDKEFVFRADPHFAHVLRYGNVDAVTIANNHTIDFFAAGMADTRAALSDAGILYFGNEFYLVKEVNGINIGLFGHRIWHDSHENRQRVHSGIQRLRADGAQLIIMFNHWGDEHVNHPAPYQISFGRYAVRAGVDLIVGAHPHVIQGIENYRGSYIVYSLANFSFGGNANPRDQDSFIFQQTFTFYRGTWNGERDTNTIPIRISSIRTTNDFVPTPAEGADAERILARLARYSREIGQ